MRKIYQITKNIPDGHKIYQLEVKYINKMTIKYTNIFRCKALQNLPKLGFFGVKNIPSGNPGVTAEHGMPPPNNFSLGLKRDLMKWGGGS
jgi:hypothetical protein